jgi:predicted TIM-barrel fold metal-dependent hydrolase
MTTMPYRVFDADNHYYEAPDAFTRYVDRKMAPRCMQWVEIDGRTRLLVGGKVNNMLPNPQFDPVAKPGCLWAYFKGENPDGQDMRALFGELEPIHPEYRDRDARLAVMDEQGVDQVLLFPTLGVLMEHVLAEDPEACVAAFHAFNRWLDDDWGFSYRDRIFSAPYLTLVDPAAAVVEVEALIARGARLVNVRAAPVETAAGPRSPADPVFDGVWARLEEANVLVCTHLGVASRIVADRWETSRDVGGFRPMPLRWILSVNRDITDFCAAVIAHGLFARFPRLRLMSVENGASWVGPLKKLLKKAHAQNPGYFPEDPLDIFDRHIWVTPFWEDPIDVVLADLPADRIVFGSDWPHAEGTAHPLDYAETVADLDAGLQRRIMRENVLTALGV